ncbi:MAG: hypothetical protein ACR2MN_07150 [Acidimicrobiales bacterium]
MIASANPFSLNATLVAELVIFALVALVVAKVVIPPLRRAMTERQATIDVDLATATEAKDRLAFAEAESRRILADARREGSETVAMYQRMATDIDTDARRRARDYYQRAVTDARREADARLHAVEQLHATLR